jgi:hydantoinase/carbamoylase family amidase
MRDVGLDPDHASDAHWTRGEVAAFLELHVEQARTLEDQGASVGIVDGIAGGATVLAVVRGRANHAGEAMRERADALAAASEIVLAVEAAGHDAGRSGLRATVCRLEVKPNSNSIIPGLVRLSIDLRESDAERLRSVASSVANVAAEICHRRGVAVEVQVADMASPTILPTWLRQLGSACCQKLELDYRVVASGEGRDAQVMNHLAPTGLVLVPSRLGLSHVPQEWTSSVDIARGAVLMTSWIESVESQLNRWGETTR